MNATSKQSLPSRRSISAGVPYRRSVSNEIEQNIDLFSRNHPATSTEDSDVSSYKVGSAKHAGNVLDDLLSLNCGGQHDYDWLLSPPGTPVLPSSDGSDYPHPPSVTPRRSSFAGRTFSIDAQKIPVPHISPKNCHLSTPARNSSARSSVSTIYSSNKSTSSFLNTSSSSSSSASQIRPSSPYVRSKSSSMLPSTPTKSSHYTTPISPQTPQQRQHKLSSSSNSSMPCSSISRPFTPTRRISSPSLTQMGPSPVGLRVPPHQFNFPDFPHDTPPNLRTSLPDRPLSSRRSGPGAAVTLKGNTETPKRPPSPAVTSRKLLEPTGRACAPESSMRKPPPNKSTESVGFGRRISKKLMDVAFRHMDIRKGTGSTIFPHGIRLVNRKSQPGRDASAPGSVDKKLLVTDNLYPKNDTVEHNEHVQSAKLSKVDIIESTRYDSILLKEGLENTTWLHSIDDNKFDQGPFLDNGFDSLPELYFEAL